MDTSGSDDNWGARHHHIFHSGYFHYRRTFRTVLDSFCCVTESNIADMDTSLSDIIEAHVAITTLYRGMHGFIS